MTAGNHKGFLQMKDSIYYGPEDDGITLLFFFHYNFYGLCRIFR